MLALDQPLVTVAIIMEDIQSPYVIPHHFAGIEDMLFAAVARK